MGNILGLVKHDREDGIHELGLGNRDVFLPWHSYFRNSFFFVSIIIPSDTGIPTYTCKVVLLLILVLWGWFHHGHFLQQWTRNPLPREGTMCLWKRKQGLGLWNWHKTQTVPTIWHLLSIWLRLFTSDQHQCSLTLTAPLPLTTTPPTVSMAKRYPLLYGSKNYTHKNCVFIKYYLKCFLSLINLFLLQIKTIENS